MKTPGTLAFVPGETLHNLKSLERQIDSQTNLKQLHTDELRIQKEAVVTYFTVPLRYLYGGLRQATNILNQNT
jgi:hypothetical protein